MKAIAELRKRLDGKAGSIKFHQCDISTIKGAQESAEAFKKIESRIDILIANAAISMAYQDELSPDGYEKTFATNHLGHMAFIMPLLGMNYQPPDLNLPRMLTRRGKLWLKILPIKAMRLASLL